MNFIIPGLNVKVLGRALQTLAKVGEELFLEAKEDELTFLTFNQNKTVCSQFHLFGSFFSIYNVDPIHFNEHLAVTCQIHMKTLLPVFKGTHLEKKLEFIKIEFQPPNDYITFKIKYNTDDITVSHALCLLDPEVITIQDYSNSRSNSVSAGSPFFNKLLGLFGNSDNEITLEITKPKIVAKNFSDGGSHRPKSVRSEVDLYSSEFSSYKINEESTISFSLKPFRTAISFAEGFNLNIGIDFDKGGSPLCMVMKNPTFSVVFIVATIDPHDDGLSTISTVSVPAKITHAQKNKDQHNITHEDIEAIANENWEDVDMEANKKNPVRDKNSNKTNKLTSNNCFGSKETNSNTKGPKKFILEDDTNQNDIVTEPEILKRKRMKIFRRSDEDMTFNPTTMRNNILKRNSDSE